MPSFVGPSAVTLVCWRRVNTQIDCDAAHVYKARCCGAFGRLLVAQRRETKTVSGVVRESEGEIREEALTIEDTRS